MLKNTFAIIVTLIISISFISCDMAKDMMPAMTGEDTDTETDETDDEVTNPFDEIYEPEPPTDEPPAFEKQTAELRRVGTQTNDDPKRQGIFIVTFKENVKFLKTVDRNFEVDDDGINDGYTFESRDSVIILPPNTAQFKDYHYLPFLDVNGESTAKIGDEIEIIQHEIDKNEFIILQNLTRPEVDYSIFWE